ncbi:putative CRISPR-associated protein [Escherichia coli]|uniref:Putative CRISPR-associated protein n=1 Tax=Escherichia coli TaxID=562 RepID=A0A377CUV2_ECOLX|nr:putative CRISPR-associated protein [Escherichia coli]
MFCLGHGQCKSALLVSTSPTTGLRDSPGPICKCLEFRSESGYGISVITQNRLKSAWFENPKEAKVDFSMVEIAFWQETEASFRSLFNVLVNDPQRSEKNTRNALRQWEAELHTYIVNVFDWDAFSDPDCPDKILLRQLNARQVLINFYRKSKALKDVLALAEEQKDAKHDE